MIMQSKLVLFSIKQDLNYFSVNYFTRIILRELISTFKKTFFYKICFFFGLFFCLRGLKFYNLDLYALKFLQQKETKKAL